MGAERYTELRSTGAFVVVAILLFAFARDRLRVAWREVPLLAFYGVVGFAFVQWFYFVAIERLPIGIGLLLEYTAPVLVALWARFAWHEPVRRRAWVALALALGGLVLVAQIWRGFTLDRIGVAAGFGAAVALAVYFLVGEKVAGRRDPFSILCIAMGFAALFWSVAQPWWSFPFETLDIETSLQGSFADTTAPIWGLVLWTIVLGTIAPFLLSIAALQHLPATTVGTLAMFEPVAATAIAWIWLDESFSAVQVVGGTVVLVGIVLALTSRS